MIGREGAEGAAVERLTSGIVPDTSRLVLERCLRGDLPASEAVRQLIALTGEPDRVRAIVDEITGRAAESSRSGDLLIRDRVDELTQLVVDPETLNRI